MDNIDNIMCFANQSYFARRCVFSPKLYFSTGCICRDCVLISPQREREREVNKVFVFCLFCFCFCFLLWCFHFYLQNSLHSYPLRFLSRDLIIITLNPFPYFYHSIFSYAFLCKRFLEFAQSIFTKL